jgi:hypothetical protein
MGAFLSAYCPHATANVAPLRFTIVTTAPSASSVSFSHLLPGQGVSAFKDGDMLMSLGKPVITRYFDASELQEYICTLEKAIDEEPNVVQQCALQRIRCAFVVSLDILKQNHEELCKEAPSGADFEEYLMSYAKAIKGGAV